MRLFPGNSPLRVLQVRASRMAIRAAATPEPRGPEAAGAQGLHWGILGLSAAALGWAMLRQQPAAPLPQRLLPAQQMPEMPRQTQHLPAPRVVTAVPEVDRGQAIAASSRGFAAAGALDTLAKRVLLTVDSPGAVKGVQLAMQSRSAGRFVCLHEADDVKSLLTHVRPTPGGAIALVDGPLREVFNHGGTLFINYNNFTQPEAESLNELFARVPTYAGAPVHPELRIVGVLSRASVGAARWSTAFFNRFHRLMAAPVTGLPEDPADTIPTVQARDLHGAHVLDLHSGRPWQALLTSHVALDTRGALRWVESPLATLLSQGKRVVLRNPPLGDAHFIDFMRGVAQTPGARHRLAYFHGYTAAEQSTLAQRHTLQAPDAQAGAYTVTARGFAELFEQTVAHPNGRVATAPGVLHAGRRVLHIATPLSEPQWNALLGQQIAPLTLSLAATVPAPAALANRVPEAAPLPQPTPMDLRTWTPKQGTATVLHTHDVDAAAHALQTRLPQVMRVDASNDLQADELLAALHKEAGRYRFAARPMATHLARGGVVLLRGLEKQANLQQDLAAQLLTPPPQGALVVLLQSGSSSPLLQQVREQGRDSTDPAEHAERIAQALAKPGLDANTVARLLSFAEESREANTTPPSIDKVGLAFMRKLAAYHAARDGAPTGASWGHSLADLLRHERGCDAAYAGALSARAQAAFGDAPPVSPASTSTSDIAARQRLCGRILRQHRAVFLQGPPGAGKSYQAQAVARDDLDVSADRLHTLSVGPATCRADLLGRHVVRGDSIVYEDGPLATWARDNRPGIKLLVVDEANLPRPGFWQFLRSAFDAQPSLLIDGSVVPLSPEHKIIFTGNDDHVVGRHVHSELRDCFVPQHLAAYTPDFLRDHIALPTLRRLAPQLPAQQAAQLAQKALHMHQAMAQLPQGVGLSPRNLEEALVRAAYALSQPGTDMDRSLSAAYAGLLAPEARAGLEAWEVLAGGLAPQPPAPALGANTQGIVWTHSTCNFARAVDEFLNVRDWRVAQQHSAVGQVGLLVQGPSGRGKDEVVAQRLQARKIPHGVLNAGMDYVTFTNAIQTARTQGTVVVLSEMNLLPAGLLEGRLNDVLSGPDTHPGFALIATLNPPTFSGRAPLSDALLNRFVVHNLGEYDAAEVGQLVHNRLHMLRSPADMDCLTRTHNTLVQAAQRARSPYVPSARELVRGAERLAEDPTLSAPEVVAELYALQNSLFSSQVSQVSQIPTETPAPAWTTLAALLQPQGDWRVMRSAHAGPRGARSGKVISVSATASSSMQQAQLVWQLLRIEPGFATPGAGDPLDELRAQLHSAARRYPALAAEFAHMREHLRTQSLQFTAPQASTARATQTNLAQHGLAWVHGAASLVMAPLAPLASLLPTPPAWAATADPGYGPVHRDRMGSDTSGLGSKDARHRISGRWKSPSFEGEGRAYFVQRTFDTFLPDGTMIRNISAPAAAQPPAQGVALGEMVLWPGRQTLWHGKQVAELFVPTGQQPVNVTCCEDYGSAAYSIAPERTPEGLWIAELPEATEVMMMQVRYTLIAAPPEDPTPWEAAAEQPLPFAVDYTAWPELAELVAGLDLGNPEAALHSLQHFFNTHVRYSLSASVRDRYAASKRLPLVNQLLALRTGSCFETAHAFAAIARHLLGNAVPVRLVGGHMGSSAGISDGHAWVEAYLPNRGWTVFDPTGGDLDEATRASLGESDVWPSHVLAPVTLEQLQPLQDVPPRKGVAITKRSAVAAEIASAFNEVLADRAADLLFTASLDVRDSFAQIPGRLEVERLVRGEVEPFVAQAVGRAQDPKTVLLSARHPALSVNGDSAAHETLRALFALNVPVRVFRSNGEMVAVRSLAEAFAQQEGAPLNRVLQGRQTTTLQLYGAQLATRPTHLVSQDLFDPLFQVAANAWLELAQSAKSLPQADRAWRWLELGDEFSGLGNDPVALQNTLRKYAHAKSLTVCDAMPQSFSTLELPFMPNLQHLYLDSQQHVELVLPHHQGPLRVEGHLVGSGVDVWLTVYASDPSLVTVAQVMQPHVRVLPASAWAGQGLPPGEYLVQEPLDLLQQASKEG